MQERRRYENLSAKPFEAIAVELKT